MFRGLKMSDLKSSEREIVNLTLAAVMASFPQLGIDMSIAARLSGHWIKNLVAKDIESFLPKEKTVKAVLDNFSKMTEKFGQGAKYKYENLTENGFDLEISNCYFSPTHQILEATNINPPICIAFGITAAVIEDLTGKVVSIKESTYDPATRTCKHKMVIE